MANVASGTGGDSANSVDCRDCVNRGRGSAGAGWGQARPQGTIMGDL